MPRPTFRDPRAIAGAPGATEEVNPRTGDLDTLDTQHALEVMNDEDARVHRAVRAAIPAVAQLVNLFVAVIRSGRDVILVGAGSSGRIALMEAAELSPTFGIDARRVRAVVPAVDGAAEAAAEDDARAGEQALRAAAVGPGDLVIGVSASGTTPYVIGGLKQARAAGAYTALITANHPSNSVAIHVVEVATGPEVITGSTRLKAGTAQKLVLNMLSTIAMAQLGLVYGNLMVAVRPTNAKLRQRAIRIVAEGAEVSIEEATRALATARDDPKLAVILAATGLSTEDGAAALERHCGNLRAALAAAPRRDARRTSSGPTKLPVRREREA